MIRATRTHDPRHPYGIAFSRNAKGSQFQFRRTVQRSLFELGLIGMATISPDDKHWIETNTRLREMLGYSRDELQKIAWADLLDARDKEPMPAEKWVVSEKHGASCVRRRFPDERRSITHKFDVVEHEGYLTAGMYDDGALGEIFITMAK